jgi:stage III sporulation protein AH
MDYKVDERKGDGKMTINKKNTLMTVVLVLVMAVGAFNYYLTKDDSVGLIKSDNVLTETSEGDGEVVAVINDESSTENIADSEEATDVFFSGKNNYFLDYRFEREETRAAEINTINELINASETSKEIKEKAQNRIFDIAENMETELHIEGLIKAKGFEDAVVMLGEETVSVVVKQKSLSEEDATIILEILTKETERDPACMSIIPQG